MLRALRQRPDIVDFQCRLQESLYTWYPDLRCGGASLACVKERELRWSRHLVYEIVGAQNYEGRDILVKFACPVGSDGRGQGDVRPSSHPLAQEYHALSLLHKYLGTNQLEGVAAVRPLTYLPDIEALAIEYMPGRSILSLLLSAALPIRNLSALQAAVDAAHNGGRALAALHHIRRGDHPREGRFDSEEYLRRLDQNLETLMGLLSSEATLRRLLPVQKTVHQLGHLHREITTFSHLHGDYYPENVVRLPDGRVYIVDTTLHQTGPVEDDIAKFLVGVRAPKRRLLGGSLLVRSDSIDAIERAFLAGYRTQARFSSRILLLSTLLALFQRWTEALQVLAQRAPAIIASGVQRARINPLMLSYANSILNSVQKESPML